MGTGRRSGLVMPTILLLLGFLVAAAAGQERVREERLPSQSAELLALIRARRVTVEDLRAELGSLSQRLADVRAEQARGSQELSEAVDRLERLGAPAGFGPVRGPGVVVELADSSEAPRTGADETDLRIQDVDLRLVVNTLWQAGAEAVSVNGRRIVATTAIRRAGDSILVNLSAASSPYHVAAIGDPAVLEAAVKDSDIAAQFEIWSQVYGLGFLIRSDDAIEVEGIEPPGSLAWASPVGEEAG